ncbi:hypothetical protein E2C01_068654 [Portunus trituberculatus]|uniref:Uncharacterized protein n=1 Tax=Portunus trituberculatus TaxID=210409 RepID=A0A5B7HYG8_PORTR|nr:hypothetical protein [Portunus trituberculatus]
MAAGIDILLHYGLLEITTAEEPQGALGVGYMARHKSARRYCCLRGVDQRAQRLKFPSEAAMGCEKPRRCEGWE